MTAIEVELFDFGNVLDRDRSMPLWNLGVHTIRRSDGFPKCAVPFALPGRIAVNEERLAAAISPAGALLMHPCLVQASNGSTAIAGYIMLRLRTQSRDGRPFIFSRAQFFAAADWLRAGPGMLDRALALSYIEPVALDRMYASRIRPAAADATAAPYATLSAAGRAMMAAIAEGGRLALGPAECSCEADFIQQAALALRAIPGSARLTTTFAAGILNADDGVQISWTSKEINPQERARFESLVSNRIPAGPAEPTVPRLADPHRVAREAIIEKRETMVQLLAGMRHLSAFKATTTALTEPNADQVAATVFLLEEIASGKTHPARTSEGLVALTRLNRPQQSAAIARLVGLVGPLSLAAFTLMAGLEGIEGRPFTLEEIIEAVRVAEHGDDPALRQRAAAALRGHLCAQPITPVHQIRILCTSRSASSALAKLLDSRDTALLATMRRSITAMSLDEDAGEAEAEQALRLLFPPQQRSWLGGTEPERHLGMLHETLIALSQCRQDDDTARVASRVGREILDRGRWDWLGNVMSTLAGRLAAGREAQPTNDDIDRLNLLVNLGSTVLGDAGHIANQKRAVPAR